MSIIERSEAVAEQRDWKTWEEEHPYVKKPRIKKSVATPASKAKAKADESLGAKKAVAAKKAVKVTSSATASKTPRIPAKEVAQDKAFAAKRMVSESDAHMAAQVWSHSFRNLPAKNANGFVKALKDSQTGKGIKGSGTHEKIAKDFLKATSERATKQKTIHRGILMTPKMKEEFAKGNDVDLPLSSFSKDEKQADTFGHYRQGVEGTHAIIHVAPGAKGWDIAKHSYLPAEQEVVSGGRFHVDRVAGKHIYVTQHDFSTRAQSELPEWFPGDFNVDPDTYDAFNGHAENDDSHTRDWKKWEAEHPYVDKGRTHKTEDEAKESAGAKLATDKKLAEDKAKHTVSTGKFNEQDKAVMQKAHDDAAKLPKGDVITHAEKMNDEEYLAHREHVEHELVAHGTNDLMRSPVSTHNSEDRVAGVEGAYTPERLALHKQIIDEYTKRGESVPNDRRAIITAGLGGAGKSTVLRKNAQAPDSVASKMGIKYDSYDKDGNGVGEPTNFVTLNPDDIKERMAQLGAVPKVDHLSPMEASPFVHEEASAITEQIAKRMQSQGKNVIHDVTLNSVGSGDKRISALRNVAADPTGLGGYHVGGVMVDVSTKQSLQNAAQRHRGGQDRFNAGSGEGGRFVPSDLITGAEDPGGQYRSKNRAAFEQLKSEGKFDKTLTIDNEAYAGKVLDETGQTKDERDAMVKAAKVEGGSVSGSGDSKGIVMSSATRAESTITDQIVAYRKGQMKLQDLAASLGSHDYATPSHFTQAGATMNDSEEVDRNQPGTWGEVQNAWDTGLLTDDEYTTIHKAAFDSHKWLSSDTPKVVASVVEPTVAPASAHEPLLLNKPNPEATRRIESGVSEVRNWKEWDEEHPYADKGHKKKWLPEQPLFGKKKGNVKESLSDALGAANDHKPYVSSYKPKPPPPPKTPEELAAEQKLFDERQKLAGDYAHRDLHTEGAWEPRNHNSRYGAITFDPEGRVLLREPLNHFDGFAWTFPKGHPDTKDEHPTQVALRENEEETGLHGKIVGHVPGGFKGGTTSSVNHFYLAHDSGQAFDPTIMNGETSKLVWATPQQADEMMQQGTNLAGVHRDRTTLRAAIDAHNKAFPDSPKFPDLPAMPPPPPPPAPYKPKVSSSVSQHVHSNAPKKTGTQWSSSMGKKDPSEYKGVWKPGMKLPGERTIVTSFFDMDEDMLTRNWKKWKEEHPYIHKGYHHEFHDEAEAKLHEHLGAEAAAKEHDAAKDMIAKNGAPDLPKTPTFTDKNLSDKELTERSALVSRYATEAQAISDYKADSTRGKNFMKGYVNARMEAHDNNLLSETAHDTSVQHTVVAEEMQANQARAKREGVAAGFHAHSVGYGEESSDNKVTAVQLTPGDTVRLNGLNPRQKINDGSKADQATHTVPMGKSNTNGPVRTVASIEALPQINKGGNNVLVHFHEGESVVLQTNAKLDKVPKSTIESSTVNADLAKPVTPSIGDLDKVGQVPKTEEDLAAMKELTPGQKFMNGETVPNTGTNGGKWYEDASGKGYFLKGAQSTEHAENEVAGALAYKQAGVKAQDVSLVKMNNGTTRALSHYVPGIKPILSPADTNDTTRSSARAGSGMDALMSHYDLTGLVMGNGHVDGPNLFKDKDGNVVRLDLGGTGRFRAQGGKKATWKVGAWQGAPDEDNDYETVRKFDQGKLAYGVTKPGVANLPTDMSESLNAAADFDTDKYHQAMLDAGISKEFADDQVAVLKDRQDHLKSKGFGTVKPSIATSTAPEVVESGATDLADVTQAAHTNNYQDGHVFGTKAGEELLASGQTPEELHAFADTASSGSPGGYLAGVKDGYHAAAAKAAANYSPQPTMPLMVKARDLKVGDKFKHHPDGPTYTIQGHAPIGGYVNVITDNPSNPTGETYHKDYEVEKVGEAAKPTITTSTATMPDTKYLSGSPKHKAFMQGVQKGDEWATDQGLDADEAQHHSTNFTNKAASLGPGVKKAEQEGFAAGIAQHASGASIPTAPTAAASATTKIMVKAKNLQPGDMVKFPGHMNTEVHTVTSVDVNHNFSVNAINQDNGATLSIGGASLGPDDRVELIGKEPVPKSPLLNGESKLVDVAPGTTYDDHTILTNHAFGGDPYKTHYVEVQGPNGITVHSHTVNDSIDDAVADHEEYLANKEQQSVPKIATGSSTAGSFVNAKSRMEFHAGTSNKFYESEVHTLPDGKIAHVRRWGSTNPGAHVNESVTKFNTKEEAFGAHLTTITAKTGKGYVEVKPHGAPVGYSEGMFDQTHSDFAQVPVEELHPGDVISHTLPGGAKVGTPESPVTVKSVNPLNNGDIHVVVTHVSGTGDGFQAKNGTLINHHGSAPRTPSTSAQEPTTFKIADHLKVGDKISHNETFIGQVGSAENPVTIEKLGHTSTGNVTIEGKTADGHHEAFSTMPSMLIKVHGSEAPKSPLSLEDLGLDQSASLKNVKTGDHFHGDYKVTTISPVGGSGYSVGMEGPNGKTGMIMPPDATIQQTIDAHEAKLASGGGLAKTSVSAPLAVPEAASTHPDAYINAHAYGTNLGDHMASEGKTPTQIKAKAAPYYAKAKAAKGLNDETGHAAALGTAHGLMAAGKTHQANIKDGNASAPTIEGEPEGTSWTGGSGAQYVKQDDGSITYQAEPESEPTTVATGAKAVQLESDLNKSNVYKKKLNSDLFEKTGNAAAPMSAPVKGAKTKTAVMAKNLKDGDQLLINGKHVTISSAPNEDGSMLVKGDDHVDQAHDAFPNDKFTKLTPLHPQYVSAAETTSGNATITSSVTGAPPADFVKAFTDADKLTNLGKKEALPQKASLADHELINLSSYDVAKERAKFDGADLTAGQLRERAGAAKIRQAAEISASAQAAYLGAAHGFQEAFNDAAVKSGDSSVPVTDFKSLPAYSTAKAEAENLAQSGTTSRDLYAKAGAYKAQTDDVSQARYLAYHEQAEETDAAENEKPLVDIDGGHPDMTSTQVAAMNESAKPTSKDSVTDLQKWAYDQGRAVGINAGNAAVDNGLSASDIEAKAIEEDSLAKTTNGLLQRKHQGIAKGLHRVAQAHYNGNAKDSQGNYTITTSASDKTEKPDVKYHGPISAGGKAHGSYPVVHLNPTSAEKAAIGTWTQDYRFATQTPFISAINKIMQGKDPGASAPAEKAKTFMKMAAEKSTPSTVTIYRGTNGGEFGPGQMDKWKAAIAKGETVDFSMPVSSSTYSSGVWSGKNFRYVIDPGALTADIGQFGHHVGEIETVTGGLMEVYKIEQGGSTTYIHMRQKIHYVT